MNVTELAARLEGRVEGDGAVAITGVAGIREAGAGDLTFLADPRYEGELARTRAAAVLVAADWSGAAPCTLIRVADVGKAMTAVVGWFTRVLPPPAPGIHPTAVIAANVRLGRGVSIGPYAVLEPDVQIGDRTSIGAHVYVGHGVTIGSDSRLYPLVSVREFVRIGARAIIHNGAVIGSDGFGYTRADGKWRKIPQTGTVVIGDDVEIGANVTVDRARFGVTRIGSGTKIDNLVQVAHNVTIGDDTAIAAQAGISGSTAIGARVQLGGQVGLAGHIAIGDDSVVAAQSGVHKNVPPGSIVAGYPAVPHMDWARSHVNILKLPEMKKRLAALEQRLQALERPQTEESQASV